MIIIYKAEMVKSWLMANLTIWKRAAEMSLAKNSFKRHKVKTNWLSKLGFS